MMMPEAAIIRQVQASVDTWMCNQERQGEMVGQDAIRLKIDWELSRMASPEEASYLANNALKLFNTKGKSYSACTGQTVMVTYEEQDGEGYFTHIDYLGHVKAVDPFDGICVSFGDDVDNWWVDDEDEWQWLDDDLVELLQTLD